MSTFFVRASGGSDLNDGLTFANGWATLQKAHDTAVAGDTVLAASDGVHTPTVQILLDTQSGTVSSMINFRGAGPLGEDDGSIVTVTGASVAGVSLYRLPTANLSNHLRFEGFRFTAGNIFNFQIDNTVQNLVFQRCRIDNAVNHGIRYGVSGIVVIMIDCEIDNNGVDGIGQSSTGRGQATYTNCIIHDNVGHGIATGTIIIYYSWIYKNGGDGLRKIGTSTDMAVINCVIDDNTGDGITNQNSNDISKRYIMNNIISNNGGWGMTDDGDGRTGLVGPNFYFNNTLGHVSFDGISEDTFADFDTLPGSLEDTDPAFSNVGDGTEDYRTSNSSTVIGTAYPQTLADNSTLPGYSNHPNFGSEVKAAGGGGGSCIIGGGGL